MTKKTLTLLTLITLLASVLRLWQLGKVPISPDWDEVALGYNAYSILHTGRDEYGKLLPVVLQSFNDYKPAFYSYLIIPFIPLFDLTVFTVRLPSALFGIATVIAVFFLVKELFKRDDLALLSSFLLAISPWHIQFSRVAFETNVGFALNVFMALAFIKGLKRPWLLSLSVIFADLSIYTYQSEKVFTPLLFLALIIIYYKQLFAVPKKFLISVLVIGFVVALPMISFTLSNKESFARAKGVSIFSQSSIDLERSIRYTLYDKQHHDILGSLFNNRRFAYLKEITGNYFSHFSPNWLFITGDINRHHAPGMGLLYLWEIPFILIGIYQLLFGEYDKKTKAVIFAWFFIAPIPASVTTGVPHAVRTLNFLPIYQIFVSLGIVSFVVFMLNIKHQIANISFDPESKDHKLKTEGHITYLIFTMCFLFFIFNISYYFDQYFVQQNYFNAFEWQYGYAPAIAEVQKLSSKYNKIVVASDAPMDESYMFFLFYLKYPPAQYQHEHIGGFSIDRSFGKFVFKGINWPVEQKDKNILYVGTKHDFPDSVIPQEVITAPNGEPAILLVQGKT